MENDIDIIIDIIEQIHNEFDTASEKLLSDAKEILSEDADAASLRYLGFAKTQRVAERESLEDARRMAETIRYYKNKYPFYKFITPIQVEKICKKYELYLGSASIFSGEIPQRNVNDILKFRLMEEDMPSRQTGWTSFTTHYGSNFDRIFLSEGKWCEKKNETLLDTEKMMSVCAPKNMFELSSNHAVTDGYKIVLDPIVLQPVKGGYLIVTKWGKEASDASVQNPIEN